MLLLCPEKCWPCCFYWTFYTHMHMLLYPNYARMCHAYAYLRMSEKTACMNDKMQRYLWMLVFAIIYKKTINFVCFWQKLSNVVFFTFLWNIWVEWENNFPWKKQKFQIDIINIELPLFIFHTYLQLELYLSIQLLISQKVSFSTLFFLLF